MAKSQVPLNQRIMNINQVNRKWFNKYIEFLKDESKSSDTIFQYSNILINFLEKNDNSDISKVEYEKVSEYLNDINDSANRINSKVSVLKGFFSSIQKQQDIMFQIEQIEEFRKTREEIEQEARRATPLTVEEIVKIRNILKNDLTKLFIFEMVYQYGLKTNELEQIAEDKYSFSNNTLSLNKNKTVVLSEQIKNIIIQRNKVLARKNKSHCQETISEIGTKIGRTLIWSDIIETRKLNFFRCSLCYNKYENIPENWSLVQYQGNDNTKWIVCKTCAMRNDNNE